ncbi:helix-turn-helix domain-containing protein [Puia dinghuensis]|uniref:AraC family transcriptional regulator n=1 Tax=Puia dinghuensis TaxID=1792502 RepID=A0A8J2UIT2_9BACT|nr:helix-turn-helix transcriptional regulator [Puia dinghuensis]GGB24289.1 AraC family transcriptional regulator [Puia dinghuensis]
MAGAQPYRCKTISEFHQFRQMPKPEHPLIGVIDLTTVKHIPIDEPVSLVFDFYTIALKRNFPAKVRYGQQEYDFDEGVMSFMSPGQVFRIEIDHSVEMKQSGWMLLIHPDFLWHTPLAKKIKQYEFFDYSVNEALFLSEKEEATITGIIQNIEQEYRANIDKFSQDIIVSQLETLFNYAERFYQRQFITRKITNHKVLGRLEDLLTDYFNSDDLATKGLPTVRYISSELNMSPNYLSGLLKTLTGKSTQQHIHDKVIEKAKEKLSTTELSVSEIAYELGFEYPQSFSKLFKTRTNLSPLAFRQSFN